MKDGNKMTFSTLFNTGSLVSFRRCSIGALRDANRALWKCCSFRERRTKKKKLTYAFGKINIVLKAARRHRFRLEMKTNVLKKIRHHFNCGKKMTP